MTNTAGSYEGRLNLRALEALANLCDEWLDARAAEFDPLFESEADERFHRRKAFNDAALHLYVASHLGKTQSLSKLEETVQRHTADARYADLVLQHSPHVTLYSSPALYAQATGTLKPYLRDALERALSSPDVWSCERVPHRLLALWHFCNAYGHEYHGIAPEAAIRFSCLAHPPEATHAHLSDAYALTRIILLCNDFGVVSPRFPRTLSQSHDVEEPIESLVLRFIHEDNVEIVFELLMSSLLQGKVAEDLCVYAFDWIFEKVHRFDFAWSASSRTAMVVGRCARLLIANIGSVRPCKTELDPELARTLGQVLSAMAEYELPTAAALLKQVPSGDRRFPHACGAARWFLETQRSRTWGLGNWVDSAVCERALDVHGSSFKPQREPARI